MHIDPLLYIFKNLCINIKIINSRVNTSSIRGKVVNIFYSVFNLINIIITKNNDSDMMRYYVN